MSRRASGFTLIELIVVITIAVILIGTLLNRVWFYQEQAEKAAMMQVANALQSALIMQYGSLLAHGEEARVAELAVENPMNWLARKPENYAGEFYDPKPRSVTPGSWVFDLKTRDLIYMVNRGEYFVSGGDGEKWVRYHVRLAYEAGDKGGRVLTGVLFVPTQPYNWFGRGG